VNGAVVLYNPRARGQGLPLALVQLGSLFGGRAVHVVDGRLEPAPEARVIELTRDAACLGITVPTGAALVDALMDTRAGRTARPGLAVVWGGCHPSVLPEQCLTAGGADLCVVGQGEATFAEVVDRLEDEGSVPTGVVGTVWREGEQVTIGLPREVVDLNDLPPADYGLLDLERYFVWSRHRRLDYSTSWGRWSALLPQRVVAELAANARHWGLEEIHFNDENFFADPRRVETICHGLLSAGVRLQWSAMGRAELLNRFSDEQIALAHASGAAMVEVTGEAGGPMVLRSTARGGLAEELLDLAGRLHRAGLRARFPFVVGAPYQALAGLEETYRVVKALRRIDPAFETRIHLYVPYPDTALGAAPPPPFTLPQDLDEWSRIDLEGGDAPWVPEVERRRADRYNFYLDRAYETPRAGLFAWLLRRSARLRVRRNFFRFDVERRMADFLGLRAAAERPPAAAE
jgi:anaerobic magnesium-protoporphyrin IX monomethyl ester cyclase